MPRRLVLRAFGLAVATVAFLPGTLLSDEDSDSHCAPLYTVSANSNFRSGPGMSHSVITVIPKGATFTLTDEKKNNFYGAIYEGTRGWVYAPLVIAAGDASDTDPAIVGEARARINASLRSGPCADARVCHVVPAGEAVQVSNTTRNGFRYVVHNGVAGWMADRHIVWGTDQPAGSTLTTTASLRLRAEPNVSAAILLTMPRGSSVTGLDAWSNGFRMVSYNGTVGWAHESYLN